MSDKPKRLPPTLQRYVDHVASGGIKGQTSAEIVEQTPGCNGFCHLKQRGLIVNITPIYKCDEPYTGSRESRYVLSTFGLEHVSWGELFV